MNLEIGQVWKSKLESSYTMIIRGLSETHVLWDGIYDKGYSTERKTFEHWIRSEGEWELRNK